MSWITSYYDATIGGTGFWLQDDGRRPRPTQGSQSQLQHYPGSNDNTRLSGGKLHQALTITCAATEADLATIAGYVDSDKTLVFDGDSYSVHVESTQDYFVVDGQDCGKITLNLTLT